STLVLKIDNCITSNQTIMNYMYQLRGEIVRIADKPVTGNKVGFPVIDYSRESLPALSEPSPGLKEQDGLNATGTWLYGARWYAPSSFIDGALGTTAAKRHCDGTPL